MTSHYVTVTNKLYLDIRTDEYIILCKFSSHKISGYRVTFIGRLKPPPLPPPRPPVPGSPKKPGLNRVKWNFHISELVKESLFAPLLPEATKEIFNRPQRAGSLLHHASPLFQRTLPAFLNDDLERLQKRVLRIIYPALSYAEALI